MSIFDLMKEQDKPEGPAIENAPTGFTDVFSAASTSMMSSGMQASSALMFEISWGESQKQYKAITGLDVGDELSTQIEEAREVNFGLAGLDQVDETNAEIKRRVISDHFRKLKEQEPDKYNRIYTSEEARKRALQSAREDTQHLEKVQAGAGGFDSVAGGFAGGAVGAMVDPINLATLPFGAAAGSSILRAMGTEALINMGVEAVTIPQVKEWQTEMGVEYGFNEAVTSMLFAGVGGAAFTGVIKGAARIVLGPVDAPPVGPVGPGGFVGPDGKALPGPYQITATSDIANKALKKDYSTIGPYFNEAVTPKQGSKFFREKGIPVLEDQRASVNFAKLVHDERLSSDVQAAASTLEAHAHATEGNPFRGNKEANYKDHTNTMEVTQRKVLDGETIHSDDIPIKQRDFDMAYTGRADNPTPPEIGIRKEIEKFKGEPYPVVRRLSDEDLASERARATSFANKRRGRNKVKPEDFELGTIQNYQGKNGRIKWADGTSSKFGNDEFVFQGSKKLTPEQRSKIEISGVTKGQQVLAIRSGSKASKVLRMGDDLDVSGIKSKGRGTPTKSKAPVEKTPLEVTDVNPVFKDGALGRGLSDTPVPADSPHAVLLNKPVENLDVDAEIQSYRDASGLEADSARDTAFRQLVEEVGDDADFRIETDGGDLVTVKQYMRMLDEDAAVSKALTSCVVR